MKKYIMAIIGMAFIMQAAAQQKTYFIHMKDGRVIEVPPAGKRGTSLWFSGKAVVNDNDYTRILDIQVADTVAPGASPYATVTFDPLAGKAYHAGINNEGVGILYSTEPGVTVDNGITVGDGSGTAEGGMVSVITGLEFNTTYYVRAFLRHMGNVYYSEEHSFTTPLPDMRWYGLNIPETFYAEGSYVQPTEEMWNGLVSRYPTEFAVDSVNIPLRTYLLTGLWNEYITVEKVRTLAAGCTDKYECTDGTIYLLNQMPEETVKEFMARFDNVDCAMYGTVGLMDSLYTEACIGPDTVICSPEWGVPGNAYYKFAPIIATGANPQVGYMIDRPLLAGRNYEVQVVMAPDVEVADSLAAANRIRIGYYCGDIAYGNGKKKTTHLANNESTSGTECTTFTYTVTPESFGENVIQILGRASNSGVNNGTQSKTLRIARITVKSIPETEE